MTWYLMGFAGIGLLTGLFTGMSNSPVVATLLPLLFSLIVGTGGAYLASADFRSELGRLRFRLIGVALTSFSVTCLAASLYGVSLRTGSTLYEFLPFRTADSDPAPLPDPSRLPPAHAMRLAILRAELEAIGVPTKEQSLLLARFVSLPESKSSIYMRLDPSEILTATTAMAAALQREFDDASKRGMMSDLPRQVPRTHYILVGAASALRAYIDAPAEVKARKFDAFRSLVDGIHKAVGAAIDDKDALDWLRQHAVGFKLLEQAYGATHLMVRDNDYDLEEPTPPDEQLLQLVRVLRGQNVTSGESEDGSATTRRTLSRRPSLKR
jgi:hypothetical protein